MERTWHISLEAGIQTLLGNLYDGYEKQDFSFLVPISITQISETSFYDLRCLMQVDFVADTISFNYAHNVYGSIENLRHLWHLFYVLLGLNEPAVLSNERCKFLC